MAFESLTEKLQNVFKNLRSKGRLTEEDVKAALKEVKLVDGLRAAVVCLADGPFVEVFQGSKAVC